MKLTMVVLCFFLLIKLPGHTQGMGTYNPIKIGEIVPNVLLENMKNYPTAKSKLYDFKDKLIILDFWNKYCSSCIAAFPKMDKIQKYFGSKIQVLLVTNNNEKDFRSLVIKSPIVRSTKLPFVIGNSELYNLFPHRTEPFHVWINSDRRVIAITSGYNATIQNIHDALDGKPLQLQVREDLSIEKFKKASSYKTMLENFPEDTWKFVNYISYITVYIPNLRLSLFGISQDSTTKRLNGLMNFGATMISLYKMAFKFGHSDRIIIELENPEKYYAPKDGNKLDEWKIANIFNYELRISNERLKHLSEDEILSKLYRLMQRDLEDHFEVTGIKEIRRVKCLILKRTSSKDLLKTKNSGAAPVAERTEEGFVLRNKPLNDLLIRIQLANAGPKTPPLIDETGYDSFVDLDIRARFDDINSLKQEIKRYDLDIIEGERDIELLILKRFNN